MPVLGTSEMSRATGLSLKALRIYDANGLLTPAEVDPNNGYRRYTPAQVARGRLIAALRRLDVPLAVVGSLLDGPPAELRTRLLSWWAGERADFARRTQTVEFAAAAAGAFSPTDAAVTAVTIDAATRAPELRVRVEQRPAQTVATITRVVRQVDLIPSTLSDVVAIRRALEADGAVAGRGHWLLFHEPVGTELPGRVETCVPYDGAVRPRDAIVLREEPAARFAVVDVTARELDYPALLRFYDAVRSVAGAPHDTTGAGAPHGTTSAGVAREWYTGTWPDDPDELAAHIAMPFSTIPSGLDPAPGAESTLGS